MKVKTTLCDLPSTETRVHEHCTTSTVVENLVVENLFVFILGTEGRLYNLHRTSTTVKTVIFPALKQEFKSIAQPLQSWKLYLWSFLVLKRACTTSSTVKTTLSDLPSTETGFHKHSTTSTIVKSEFQHIPGTETHLYNLHRTTTTAKMTSSELPSTGRRVQKHCTASTVVKMEFQHIPCADACLPNLLDLHKIENQFI